MASLWRKTWVRSVAVVLAGVALSAGFLASSHAAAAERLAPMALIDLARQGKPTDQLRQALLDTLGEARLKAGTAYLGQGPNFVFAVQSTAMPELFVDDRPSGPLTRLEGSDLWYATTQLRVRRNHTFNWEIDGKRVGGDFNVVAYGPESYEQPGVPKGTLTPVVQHTSKSYEGMVSPYWVYVPAQYDPKVATPVMIWTDGGGHVDRNGGSRTQNVIDNLIHQKRIPVMIQVFTSPGDIAKAPGTKTFDYVSNFSKRTGRSMNDSMRSTEYDTVSDRYVRFLLEEILAEVGQKYNLRQDGYSRGIAGDSSGGIAAFNASWQKPDAISRVLSRVGTFTSIQWIPGQLDGGNIFPFAVRKEPRKNMRIWMSDGAEDLENEHGSWPFQNLQLANSLKMAGYDFHFTWSGASHSGAQGSAESPEALTWLWRDYDPAKTTQTYEQDPAEKGKPYYRVRALNRE